MSKFTGPLTITEIDVDRELWRLEEPLDYYVNYEELPDGTIQKSDLFRVPKGYVSDGASRPWFIGWLYPRWGKYRRPAVGHDYAKLMIDKGTPEGSVDTYEKADRMFLGMMYAMNINIVTRYLFYYGAVLGTKFPWLGRMFINNSD